MGIFSFLGKKDRREASPDSQIDAPRRRRDDRPPRSESSINAERLANSQIVQRDAARKTALKIDAIESEMSSELTRPPTTSQLANGTTAPSPKSPSAKASIKITSTSDKPNPKAADAFLPTLPPMNLSTDILLGCEAGQSVPDLPVTETAPVIEEAAILFANDQNEMVETMLLAAIEEGDLGSSTDTAWWMLFDLYQILGNQIAFDSLAIRYASEFERSPPTWVVPSVKEQNVIDDPVGSGTTVALSGKLDETIQKQLDRAKKLGESNSVLRLEFARVTAITPEGCALLLASLKKLQRVGGELVLVNAGDFAIKVRSILEVGRRDETEAPWLLLLEILQLLNRQQEFEETSIDYCVTFEVSPPAFIVTKSRVKMETDDTFDALTPPNVFMMPALVDNKTDLIDGITQFAKQHNPAIIDCSRLARVDFSAASQLLSGLAPLAGNNRSVELHNVNQLVAALFNVMGIREIARILPRKH